jgi:NCAIR mutase (PurE)-related protein
MMDLEKLLKDFKNNKVTFDALLTKLKNLPYENLNFALIDHHRVLRQGFPEVIYSPGKNLEQIKKIAKSIVAQDSVLLVTRAERKIYEYLKSEITGIAYNDLAGVIYSKKTPHYKDFDDKLLIVSAGTSDIPVAEEAFQTALSIGFKAKKIFDVGVAGLHRLLHHKDIIEAAEVIIVVAGMEGALASVVGGLVSVPLIAVPTSAGYGTSFNGLAALLAMLNSCANGITVVNIDNGFGAAFSACKILKQIYKNKVC